MIIPIKCFTCGNVIADKYRFFKRQVSELKAKKGEYNSDNVVYLTENTKDKTPEGIVMDELGLTRQCCRRHLLTHVDIE
uniref:DNA-directed RNA polymerase subunit N n=1 Tax=viral metagenome TaxID=1070528 RepID=A0A6C0BQF7_9ZZZZ